MSSLSAANHGSGSQFVKPDGEGNQFNATGGSLTNINGPNINFTLSGQGGMPALHHILNLVAAGKAECSEPSRTDMIDWLMRQSENAPLDLEPTHRELLSQLVKGTGTWVLRSPEFERWKNTAESSRVLWMYGILGSGKTMLLTRIVDHLTNEIKDQKDCACVYFYFGEVEQYNLTLARIWATLLKQLLDRESSDLADKLKTKFNNSLHGSTQLHPDGYLDLFRAQAATFKTVYLIIDALDRCQDSPGEKNQQQIEDALNSLPPCVQLLFTSRAADSIGKHIGAHQSLVIRPKKEDVKIYVERQIQRSRRLSDILDETEVRGEVIKGVVTMTLSSEMFLLAVLHMDNLRNQCTLGEIKTALKQLPDSTFDVFKASATKIAKDLPNNSESRLAKHIFTWVLHAKTQICAEHIRESFAVQNCKGQPYREHMPAKILLMRACLGLIVMDPKKGTLSLIHKSAQWHLQQNGLISQNADLEIAKTCLTCLMMDPCNGANPPLSLLQYSAKYWRAHLGPNREPDRDTKLESLVFSFLSDSSKMTRAFRVIGISDGDIRFDKMTGLHAAVHFDLLSYAERLLKQHMVDIDAQCADDQTALHWAVRYGRQDFVKLFIENSANVNIKDHHGETPLHKVLSTGSSEGSPEIVRLLVAGKARLDTKNNKGHCPLSLAIKYGPTSIAKVMIESQDDVNAEDFEGWTSLRHVFYHGQNIATKLKEHPVNKVGQAQLQDAIENHGRILVDLLLDLGVDLNRPTSQDKWTPLIHATKNGDLFKLRRLLARKNNSVNIHLLDKDGVSALRWAVEYQKDAAVKLLVEHGANVNEVYPKNIEERTALFQAVKRKYTSTLELLLSLGADPDMTSTSGSTTLIEAVKLNNQEMVWMLLRAKAKPNGTDGGGFSALYHAVKNRNKWKDYKTLAWILVNNGCSSARGVLELALASNDLSMAWLLCEHGATPSSTDEEGKTPLHRAAQAGDLKIVQFLLSRNVPTRLRDKTGSTPLHYAVLGGWDDIVALLVLQERAASPQVQVDVRDNKGITALMIAAGLKRQRALTTLLSNGASGNITSDRGHTALHMAADQGFHEGVRLLLEAGSEPNLADEMGSTPLHHVINSNNANVDTVRLLVRSEANLEARDRDGRTPLLLAVQKGNKTIVQCLLDLDADLKAQDRRGVSVWEYAKDHRDIQNLVWSWRNSFYYHTNY